MRLRQLGHGQSLFFLAPPEVHQDIMKLTTTEESAEITGLQVIEWALEQSWLQIERNQPLRVTQGLSYYRRHEAMEELKRRLETSHEVDGSDASGPLAEDLVEHEAQSLRDLYAPESMRAGEESSLVKRSRPIMDKPVQELLKLWDKLDMQTSRGANMHEELEREVGHEVEQEKQVERPPKASPETPKLDPRLGIFIRSGTFKTINCFASPRESVLKDSRSAHLLKERAPASSPVRVTNDFIKTIKRNTEHASDDYLRPGNWVLVPKDKSFQCVLLISQFEVNQCFESIHDENSRVTLVSYEPRVTRSMSSIDAATSHPLPQAKEAWSSLSWTLRQELHLFAGQLYFTKFEEYELLMETLASGTARYPLSFIKEWIGIRRKRQNYLRTHIGQVVSGRVLHREMFEIADNDVTMSL